MKRKIIALILAFCLILSACKSGKSNIETKENFSTNDENTKNTQSGTSTQLGINETINETIIEATSTLSGTSTQSDTAETTKENSELKSTDTSFENEKVSNSDIKKNKLDNSKIQEAYVCRVVDGDTIEVLIDSRKYKVRFIGVDTPETKHPRKPVQFYGKEASKFTKDSLLDKTVYLEKDISDKDRYGRLLRYIWLASAINNVNFESPTREEVTEHLFNSILVKNGYAQSYSYPPDVKYQDFFRDDNAYARENNLGLWNYELAEKFENENSNKVSKKSNSDNSNNSDFEKEYVDENGRGLIKGNINRKGEKIYHIPGSRSYEKTKIDTSKGERWFKTITEAKEAGWRAPKR